MAVGEPAVGSLPAPTSFSRSEEPKQQYHPLLRVPSTPELSAISALRSISADGLRIAVARGFLWTAELKGFQAFVITDKSRRCYTARRIDGEPWEHGRRPQLLPGSKASWPIGCMEAEQYPTIALCEGGPDFLAAFGHAWATGAEDRIAPVSMTSAAVSIAAEALPCFSGKRLRIFAHADNPGQRAAAVWMRQLEGIAAVIDHFSFHALQRSDGEPVNDLNDLSLIDYDCWEANRQRAESVMY